MESGFAASNGNAGMLKQPKVYANSSRGLISPTFAQITLLPIAKLFLNTCTLKPKQRLLPLKA